MWIRRTVTRRHIWPRVERERYREWKDTSSFFSYLRLERQIPPSLEPPSHPHLYRARRRLIEQEGVALRSSADDGLDQYGGLHFSTTAGERYRSVDNVGTVACHARMEAVGHCETRERGQDSKKTKPRGYVSRGRNMFCFRLSRDFFPREALKIIQK